MKKIKSFLIWMKHQLYQAVKRFPETIVVSVLFVVFAIWHNRLSDGHHFLKNLEKVLMVLSLALPATASLALFCERKKVNRWLLRGGVLLGLVVYYIRIPNPLNDYFMMRFAALMGLLYLLFLITPYFYKRRGLALYTLKLVGQFFVTVLYSAVMYGGLAMMIFTIETLFEVHFSSRIYADVFVAISGLFAVPFFLGNVPSLESEQSKETYSKVFKTLFLYIIIPIISVYLLILYAYFIKVLWERQLPDGVIGNLVLWHALVSTLTFYFVKDLTEILWLRKWIRFYAPLMIVPFGMLSLAIGIRIAAYGLTMPRYFVVVLAIFSLVAMGIMRIWKAHTAVPVILLLMTFVSVAFFGPLSGYALSLTHQNNRLERMLLTAGLMDTASQFQANASLDEKTKGDIQNQINYLIDSYGKDAIDVFPKPFDREAVELLLGFELNWYSRDPFGFENTFYVSLEPKFRQSLDVRNVDYLLSIDTYAQLDKRMLYESIAVEKEQDSQVMLFTNAFNETIEVDVSALAKALYFNKNLKPEQVIAFENGESLTLTFDFESVSGVVIGEEPAASEAALEVRYYSAFVFINR